ncbi:hypothetical protein Tsubulata_013150 [Turnera subulata]|uniref:Thaumatin-like protein n=1 Tax=Turnera subulata TaxID=218843 RepID=A0A9Q0J677_9ROSI|nr:hypothetical protein Tsubulata_013150 [Turnera subulata]
MRASPVIRGVLITRYSKSKSSSREATPVVLFCFPLRGFLHLDMLQASDSVTFTIANNCPFTVWPAARSNAAYPELSETSFTLEQGESTTLQVPGDWAGSIWGRTSCSKNPSGNFVCATGDFNSSSVQLVDVGKRPALPVTLANFHLVHPGGEDMYHVSVADGYNLPMIIRPQRGTGNTCVSTGCIQDLNPPCPPELRVVGDDGITTVACKSACLAFGPWAYCCSDCVSNSYGQFFKDACPRARNHLFDTSYLFSCSSAKSQREQTKYH